MRKIEIGLALGSDAARDWSHVGVINALKKVGIETDIVARCSIGPLVGVAYACDRLSTLGNWVTSFGYWDVLRLMDLSQQHGGLLRDERVFNQYREIIPETEIENCSRRFATITTNLSTGRGLWFAEGNLRLAIHASCNIPGLTIPVAHNGYWLVDSAVVNPIPVSLTRALEADIVIAVDLQYDAHLMQQDLLSFNVSEGNSENDDSLPWHVRLEGRLGNITTRRAMTAPTATEVMTTSIQVLESRLKGNRMTGNPPDILIQPACPQISTLDFYRTHAAVAVGQLAVEKKMDGLLPLVRTNIRPEFLSTLELILTGAGGNSILLLGKASRRKEHDAAVGQETDSHC